MRQMTYSTVQYIPAAAGPGGPAVDCLIVQGDNWREHWNRGTLRIADRTAESVITDDSASSIQLALLGCGHGRIGMIMIADMIGVCL